VSAEKKRSLYQNADLFVFPSLYEGFGIPPLEAMAYGCPVVCSNAASLPEVAGDAAEYVSAENEENIARGIARVLSDRSYAGQLTANGSMQVRKYHWESSAKRLSEICQEVLGK
ncbi:MAG: glycosyltransferase, partial [Oscillospiraceae bacterium]|nr:glycosyltransferase [Oscillospiraceae bacterium]